MTNGTPGLASLSHFEPGGRTQIDEAQIAGQRKDVPRIDESDAMERAEQMRTQLTVQHHNAVAAGRESRRGDRPLVAGGVGRPNAEVVTCPLGEAVEHDAMRSDALALLRRDLSVALR